MWCQVQATAAVPGHGCPLVRTKHAMCFTSDGHIYLYGGRSMANKPLRDLWRFDTAQDQWEEVLPREHHCHSNTTNYLKSSDEFSTSRSSSSNSSDEPSSSSSSSSSSSTSSSPLTPEVNFEPPPALQEHTIIAAKNKLYLFGGQVGYSSDETPLWIFDLVYARWSKFGGKSLLSNATTSQPLGRRGHTAVLYKNVMSIYGGYQDFKGSTAELWTFHLERQEWTKEESSFNKCNLPAGRHGHSAVVYNDSMYIYGGMTDLQVRGDFWSWSYKNKKWTRIKTVKNPGELCYHSAIVVSNSMFIYGGERANGNSVSELWKYRFDNQTWQHVSIEGVIPECRTRHVAVAIPFLSIMNNALNLGWIESFEHKHNNNNNNTIMESSFTQTNRKEQETQVEFEPNYEMQPKKSISLSFETHRTLMSPVETEPKKKIIKSNSFRHRSSPSHQSNFKEQPKYEFDNKTTDESIDNDQHKFENDLYHENDVNANNIPKESSSTGLVRLRQRRRPMLQRQRPYSDFYGNSNLLEEFELNELNEKQLKRRSVQESMSYYSLCFATPPASLKLGQSPSVVPMSPVIEPEESSRKTEAIDMPSTETDVIVRRHDSSNIRRRIRKANLQLSQLNRINTCMILPKAQCNDDEENQRNDTTYYSLGLVSPDFEKELKCTSELSTPTDELSDKTTENFTYHSDENVHYDLDLIEDYLEPEEMLEIVTETVNDKTSPTLRMKTIKKTPSRNRPQLQASVSHSSSGYQSLILGNSSIDQFSNPSLSTSNSFNADHKHQINDKHDSDNHHSIIRSITLNMSSNRKGIKDEMIELKQMKSPENEKHLNGRLKEIPTRSRSLDRTQNKARMAKHHWQPNIKETIPEIIVPRSPAISKQVIGSIDDNALYFSRNETLLRLESTNNRMKNLVSLRRYRKKHNGLNQNWQLCMYVFGGREGASSAIKECYMNTESYD
ncbi:hypothetical protein RDWZM_003204 [Blomia tropicalis]|uniref:Uncharacterized protein n=1 Tax=Blomia tropicalis TaxID=40697 RepID=A0A9Q0MFM2_BLOTA|nr:hypothetical protein RDWZM_003204 [Blomia tropicalis]